MSERRGAVSSMVFVVYSSPLSSNREENTGCLVFAVILRVREITVE